VRAIEKEVWAATANALREKTAARHPTTRNPRANPRAASSSRSSSGPHELGLVPRRARPRRRQTKTFYLARIKEAKNTELPLHPAERLRRTPRTSATPSASTSAASPSASRSGSRRRSPPGSPRCAGHPAQKLETLKGTGDVVLEPPGRLPHRRPSASCCLLGGSGRRWAEGAFERRCWRRLRCSPAFTPNGAPRTRFRSDSGNKS